jgi:AmmeMemoRadiSam system protein B
MFEQFEREGGAAAVAAPVAEAGVGGIVPHAGWVYSGRIAYHVVRALAEAAKKDPVDTIVLCGGHLSSRSSIRLMNHGDFWTPFGPIATDEALVERLAQRPNVHLETPEEHAADNTLELQAPLIKHFFPQARVVALGAPPREETLQWVEELANEAVRLQRRLMALGSTDLTHYGPNYGWSPRGVGAEAENWVRTDNDRRMIDRMCALDAPGVIAEALHRSNACCPGAVAAAIELSRRLGAQGASLLNYATSSDLRPDQSFVGYAGILFHDEPRV